MIRIQADSIRHSRSRSILFVAVACAAGLAAAARAGAPNLILGQDAGGQPVTSAFTPPAYGQAGSFNAFASSFTGGVRVASADFTGDSIPDILVGAGVGSNQIRVYDGRTFAQVGGVLAPSVPFGATYTGGVYVAAGDVNADGTPDIVVSTGGGTTNRVRVLSGATGLALADFFPYTASFTGGVRVGVGDLNADGHADIFTVPAAGGGANVKIFSGTDQSVLANFFAFDSSFTGGAFIAGGDVNGDGRADIVVAPDAGAGPNVKIFDGTNTTAVLANFLAFDGTFTGGVRVAASDVTGDGRADVFAAAGPGSGLVRGFNGSTLTQIASFQPFGSAYTGGSFVAIPEPAMIGLLGAAGLLAVRRKRRGRGPLNR